MAIDVISKYLFNNFPYVGKDESRNGDVSMPTDIVVKHDAFVQEWPQRNQ